MPIGVPQGNLDIKNATLRTSNLETQNIKIGSIFVGTGNSLEETANVGNSMSNTIQFTNTHTAFTTTGNVYVGKDLTVTGDVTASTFSDGTAQLTGGTWSGSAASLTTAVDIGGVAFDGSASIVPTTFGAATFSGDVTVDTNTLHVDATNNRVGVGTTNPNVLLELSSDTGSATIVPTELRLSSSTNATDWDTTNPYARLAFYTEDVTADAPGVMASIGAVASSVDGGENTRLAFFTAEPHVERMCIDRYGNVGVGTTTPGRKLEVYTGNGAVPGLRLRRYPTGATYTDFQHADSTSPANSKEGLAITVGDGNVTAQEVMRVCGDGFVGIGTTNPHRTLDVQAPARPSGMPFAIGGSWNNRAYYVAKEFSPGVNKSSYTIDFLIGGSERPGWLRACAGGSQSGSGTLAANAIAEFIISPYGTNFYWSRRLGDSAISLGSSGTHNGGRITVSHAHTSYPRLWFEIYHPYGVYW
jgi:hypothetical protein